MSELSELLGVGLTNAALVTVLALILGALERRLSPDVARALWILLLAKLLAPPLKPLVLPWFPATGGLSGTGSAEAISASADSAMLPAVDVVLSWTAAAGVLWVLGTLVVLSFALARIVRFRRLLRTSTAARADFVDRVGRVAAGFRVRRAPRVVVTSGCIPPTLWAFGEAVLVLPQSLVERLSTDELDTLLAHELTHLERRDHWARLLELAAVSLYWWLPIAWWARRRQRAAEETCCDIRVAAALPTLRGAYARCLMTTLRFLATKEPGLRAPTPILASRLGDTGAMKERLTMILTAETSRLQSTLSTSRRLVLVVFALALLAVFPTLARSGDEVAPDLVETAVETGSFGHLLTQVAERSGRNLVIEPGLDLSTRVDADLERSTWQEALETAVVANGLHQTRIGNVIWIHRPATNVHPGTEFLGQAIDLDIEGESLSEVLDRMKRLTGIEFVLDEGIEGRVNVQLQQVPWDQGLDVILRLQGLSYETEAGRVRVFRAAG